MQTRPANCTIGGWIRLFAPLLTCVGIPLLGCGKAEYETRMQAKIQELQYGSVFLENLYEQPIDIPGPSGQVASIRLPKLFDAATTWQLRQIEGLTGKPVETDRIQPPFGHLPGFSFCYEKYFSRQPVYCYFAVEDAAKKSAEVLLDELQKPLKAKFRAAVWTTEQLKTPTGSQITVKKISANGPQLFFLDNGDRENSDGAYELYLYSTPQHHVMVGWRAPRDLLGTTKLLEVARLSLGTLEVQGDGASES